MSKCVVIYKVGDFEQLEYIDNIINNIKSTEVLVKHTIIGLNRYDFEQCTGIRKVRNFPFFLGVEGVGIVERVGTQVKVLKVGDRVGYCTAPSGSYCERRIIDQKYLLKIPKYINDEVAAAVLFKGMAAHYLTHRIYCTQPGTFALINGVSGGLGRMLAQWSNHRGCKVIGVVDSDDKNDIALKNGCSYVLNYHNDNFKKEIMRITKKQGVNVVYDLLGLVTCRLSFEALSMYGLYVSCGQISGPIPKLNLSILNSKSLFITSPSIYHYKRSRLELSLTAVELFEVLKKGYINVDIMRRYKFNEIKKAHQDIKNRVVSGFNIITL